MPRETVEEKARRLLGEGRLHITQATAGEIIKATCRGDSGVVYHLGYDPELRHWGCTCPEQKGRCSHLIALQLVTVKRD
jgi:hypothetical protein